MSLSREQVTHTVESYLEALVRQDPDEIAGYYAPNGSIEDPIGSELKTGDGIREFYARPRTFNFIERVGVIAVTGNNAGFTFHLELQLEDRPMHVFVHEIMRFNDDGKVVSMVAMPDFGIREELAGVFPGSKA